MHLQALAKTCRHCKEKTTKLYSFNDFSCSLYQKKFDKNLHEEDPRVFPKGFCQSCYNYMSKLVILKKKKKSSFQSLPLNDPAIFEEHDENCELCEANTPARPREESAQPGSATKYEYSTPVPEETPTKRLRRSQGSAEV